MDLSFTPSHRGGEGPPMLCIHGFTDTWRTWELVLGALESQYDVFAPTLPGHAGGPPLGPEIDDHTLPDALERMMDAAGLETAHIVGNSLGGYLSLKLAERGRARSVVALAPAGGWAKDDVAMDATMDYFTSSKPLLEAAAPFVDQLVSTSQGRRQMTLMATENYEHIPPELLAHMLIGAVRCDAFDPLIGVARRREWSLDSTRIECPVRIVWGTSDKLLIWPGAAERLRTEWAPQADWVELEGVGHCPQLDVPLETQQLILGFTQNIDQGAL